MTSRIRILVADDHAVARAGIASLLSAQDDLEVVAQSSDGAEALAIYHVLNPDIVILDIEMPMIDGAEVTRLLLAGNSKARILIFSSHDDEQHIYDALKAGAHGYLTKNCDATELIEAVRAVAAGRRYIPPHIALLFAQRIEKGEVTPRQADVLRHVSEGLTNREIAQRLKLSERTVVFHVSKMLAHFGAKTRTELAKFANQRTKHD